jgi:hypothetical protein
MCLISLLIISWCSDQVSATEASRIGLKANIITKLWTVPCNWYHGYQVLEASAVLPIVDDAVLCLLASANIHFEVV